MMAACSPQGQSLGSRSQKDGVQEGPQLYFSPLAHLQPSFDLVTPAADRKRVLGSSKPWIPHRQQESARKQWQQAIS
jgi:hypothetical protein